MSAEVVNRYRRFVPSLLAALLLGLLLLINGGRLPETSGEVELLFPATSPTLDLLRLERKVFEDVYTDVILIRFTDTSSFALEDVEEELIAIPGVTSVLMPKRGGPLDELFGLTTENGEYGRIFIKIDTKLSEAQKRELNAALQTTLTHYPELSPKRAGSFVTTQEVSRAVTRETERVIPWIVSAMLLCIVLLFRDLFVAGIILGTTGGAVLTSLLLYSALGVPLGPISQLAPPFLLAVSGSFNIHFVSRLLQTDKQDRPHVVKELRVGILLAAATTALSLLTLTLLDVADVTRFSLLSACGVMLSAFYAVTLSWPWLKEYPSFHGIPLPSVRSLLLSQHASIVLFATGLSCLALSFGIINLTVDTDPLKFLPSEDKALHDIQSVNALLPGNHYLSFLIEDTSTDKSESPELTQLKERLLTIEDVERVIIPNDFQVIADKPHVEEFLSDFSLRTSSVPAEFQTSDRKHRRVLIETPLEGKSLLFLRDKIRSISREILSEKRFTFGLTSLELIMAEQTSHIVRGLLQSLGTTLLGVFLLLLFIFRDFRVALIGLTPNILPLFAVFGLLGFLSNRLDFGSCLVGASALGIAVDNTFHFLLCWKQQTETSRIERGTIETVRATLVPFTITTIALVSTFSVMALARSEPVMHFGVLLAVTLLVCLLADLIILPLLLHRLKERGGMGLGQF